MNSAAAFFRDVACNAFLRSASLIVPCSARADWLAEWRSELWHARRSQAERSKPSSIQLVHFCLGAFEDARFLAAGDISLPLSLARIRGSAGGCTIFLMVLLLFSLLAGICLPNVRLHLVPSHVANAERLVFVENSLAADHGVNTLSYEQYLTWSSYRQHIFQSFAFYRVDHVALSTAESMPSNIRLATATENMFATLGLRLDEPGSLPAGTRGLILGAEIWQRLFHGDTEVIGRTVRLNGAEVTIVAVAQEVASQLPGHPEAWTTQSPHDPAAKRRGYVIARMRSDFRDASLGSQWRMTAPLPDGSSADFDCISLSQALRQPWDIFIFAVFLALLALPATTSLPLGEYHTGPRPATHTARFGRWLFLAAKGILVLAIVYCISLLVAYASAPTASNTRDTVQLLSCFGLCLWGLRWTLRDQRQRCPVCLGKLTHPARVGHPSRSFLAWNGTELMCEGGHGLLHVPALPTSWFSTQRWLYLDASWRVLFTEQTLMPDTYF